MLSFIIISLDFLPRILCMLDNLLTSKTRIEILKLFLLDNDVELHLREIARRIEAEPNAVKRELENLQSVGVLKSKKIFKEIYFL